MSIQRTGTEAPQAPARAAAAADEAGPERVEQRFHEVLAALLDERASRRSPSPRRATAAVPGSASVADARVDVERTLIRRLCADLGISEDALRRTWERRPRTQVRTASYRSGTFVVARRPGAAADSVDEWWSTAAVEERSDWLTAWFGESTGWLQVIRVRDRPCASCGGDAEHGGSRLCADCRGAGCVRCVDYR